MLAALILVAAGCDMAGPANAPEAAASAEQAEAAASPALAEAAQGPTIDPAGGTSPESRIAAREDIRVGGQSACALTVQYAGDIEQPATFAEDCDALTVRFVEQKDLAALRQNEKLSEAEREAIAALPGGKVLYVEGTHASAIFMPNAAGFLEKRDLAD
jgi:hypothetical protein